VGAVPYNWAQDVHRRVVGIRRGGNAVHRGHDLDVAGTAQRHRALAILRRFAGVERGQRAGGAGNRTEMLRRQFERLGLVEIAADGEQRVVRLVPGAVERLQRSIGTSSMSERSPMIGLP